MAGQINKVSFLTSYGDEFPQRYRVYNLIDELTAAGVECAVLKEDFAGRLDTLFDSDLLIVVRVRMGPNVLRIINEIRHRSIPTVFDIDDLIFDPNSSGLLRSLSRLSELDLRKTVATMNQLRETLLACDYVTCTTKALSTQIERLKKSCYIIPNSINNKQYDLAQNLKRAKEPRNNGEIKIGYFSGTNTHERDFMEVSDALYEIMQKYRNVEFHLVGILEVDRKFSKFRTRVIQQPFMGYLDMLRYLAWMDINLAPLEMNNAFTGSKSELKIFEAALVEVPTVASATDSYAACLSDGVNGFLAASKEEWFQKLEILIKDEGLRRRIARRAKKEFIERFFIKNTIANVLDTYSKIKEDYQKKFVGEQMFFRKENGKTVRNDENYWNTNPEAASMSQWSRNRVIGKVVYQRMSGGETSKHWLHWLMEDFFSGKHFGRLLSPGCGTGMHEIISAKSGIVDEIDAFDFSDASLNLAREKAQSAGVKINFYKDDINTFALPDKKYDIVLCSGSVHHVTELERFYATIHDSLVPKGYFIVNEYMGDCYNIYSERQVDLINRLYRHFPDELRSGKVKTFQNSTIQKVLATDPSESVRSKLVLPFLKYYFDIEVYRPFGGFILHPLYPLLNDVQFSSDDAKTETILKLLLEFEDILMESRLFDSDFALCICRPK